MTTPVIAELTTFRGNDIAKMSDDQLLSNIKQLNNEIKDLKSYDVSSSKINARIAELELARTVLVRALDGDTDAPNVAE